MYYEISRKKLLEYGYKAFFHAVVKRCSEPFAIASLERLGSEVDDRHVTLEREESEHMSHETDVVPPADHLARSRSAGVGSIADRCVRDRYARRGCEFEK